MRNEFTRSENIIILNINQDIKISALALLKMVMHAR